MKKKLFFVLLSLIPSFLLAQLEWSSTGAKWKYIETDGAYILEKVFEYVGEEMFLGQLCKVIQKNGVDFYTYEESGKVYMYGSTDSIFQVRYDFGKQAGESWEFNGLNGPLVATVDSVTTEQFNGQPFEVQHITVLDATVPCCDFQERVVLGIGSDQVFEFPFVTDLITEPYFGLGCFYSDSTGLLEVVEFPNLEIDCTDVTNAKETETPSVKATFFPTQQQGGSPLKCPLGGNGRYIMQWDDRCFPTKWKGARRGRIYLCKVCHRGCIFGK